MSEEKQNGSALRGWFFTILAGLLLIAAAVFIITQASLRGEFSIFGGHRTQTSTSLLVLFSAVGGVIVWYVILLLAMGIRELMRYRRNRRHKLADKM